MRIRKCALCAMICSVSLFAAMPATAHAQAWKTAQASCYGPYEGECITAIGTRITDGTNGIAVPYQYIVSKATWKKLGAKQKRTRFYYGERIKLRLSKTGKTIVSKVVDCGGFAGYGYTAKNGSWVPRLFDCQPYVFHTLGFSGTATVKWKWVS